MPTHFLFPIIFPKNIFWNTEGLLYEMFRYCEMKPFRRTIVTTTPFLILIVFRFQKDFEHRKVPLRKVSVLWDQKSRRRFVMCTHFLFLNIFWHKKISETQKGSSTKCFGTVSQKNWRGLWCPPPLFTSTFFKIKNFLKRRRVALRNVSLLGNKHFRSTVVIPRPFLSSTFSPSGKLSETQKGSLTNSFGIVKQNSLTENRDSPPLFMHEKFRC